jgi:hypothetical protein
MDIAPPAAAKGCHGILGAGSGTRDAALGARTVIMTGWMVTGTATPDIDQLKSVACWCPASAIPVRDPTGTAPELWV